MNWLGELFGYLGGISTAVFFLPQSIKTIRTKDVTGLSVITYCVYLFGIICWTIYGIYMKSIPMMMFNSISGIFSITILYTIIQQQRKKK